ncbi:hypothetical protein F5882DRAFT_387782 [Hyaloscypha sp. PMI_1271]|nr:hypothetical protein F5882DRAFT_387782 [Hyaloscypha sp. PMI_1271]
MGLALGIHFNSPIGWVPAFGVLGKARSNDLQSPSTQQGMNPFLNLMGRFVRRPTCLESVSLSDLAAKNYDSPGPSSFHVSEMIPLGTFHYFSQLPMELQLHIWTSAARQEPDDGSRIFSLAPSSHRFAFTLRDVNTLYTVTSQHRPLPVVFQICSGSREAARREYVLLPTHVATRRNERKMVYAHKIHDTIFFQSDTTTSPLRHQFGVFSTEFRNLGKPGHVRPEATRLFFENLNSFRHLAVDWEIWRAFQEEEYLPLQWPRVLPSLDEVLIVLTIERTLRVPLFFRSITPGTVREESASLVMSMVDENIEAFRFEFPHLQPPKIKVVAFSDVIPLEGDSLSYLKYETSNIRSSHGHN